MAELLLSWVNNDLKLSKTVTNLDKDFANGYLLGEILHIHNQQANFNLFSNKEVSLYAMRRRTTTRPNVRLGVVCVRSTVVVPCSQFLSPCVSLQKVFGSVRSRRTIRGRAPML